MSGLELSSKVSTTEVYELGDAAAGIKIAVMDFGTKKIYYAILLTGAATA